MQEDYYKILGVNRNASEEEIHNSYRDLARRYHPDLNPDDTDAKEKFQAVQQAYEVLSEPKKREMYDRYGKAFKSVGGTGSQGGSPWPDGGSGSQFNFEDVDLGQIFGERFGHGDAGGFADVFRDFTRGGRARAKTSTGRATQGNTLRHDLDVPFAVAVTGGEAQLSIRRADGNLERITVKIPAGIENDAKIRLRGQGEPGHRGGPSGDILIRVNVGMHRWFQRIGDDLQLRVPLKLSEAVGGASVDIPTPHGTISLKVPPGTSGGTRLRVKGHGVRKQDSVPGDLYAEIQIEIPSNISANAIEWIQNLDAAMSDPRAQLDW